MKVLIADDERLARTEMRKLLEDFDHLNIIGEATNGIEAVQLIEELQPDLVLLDIEMPGKNGFEVLESLSHTPQIIFVTAYDEFAIKAFETNALDYILKPAEKERLAKALNKIKTENQQVLTAQKNDGRLTREAQIFVKDGEKCWFVKLEKIRLFESEGNYVRLYFDHSKPMILKSLNNLEDKLDERQFFRVSRKHILNLSFIEKVDNWFNGGLRVTLQTGEQIEISRRQSSRFREMMSL